MRISLNDWSARRFGKCHRTESEKMTLPAAAAADGIGYSAGRLVQGGRYKQWIASSTVKRWDVGSNLSRQSSSQKKSGGLLLLRRSAPLTRRTVAYFCSGAHTSEWKQPFGAK